MVLFQVHDGWQASVLTLPTALAFLRFARSSVPRLMRTSSATTSGISVRSATAAPTIPRLPQLFSKLLSRFCSAPTNLWYIASLVRGRRRLRRFELVRSRSSGASSRPAAIGATGAQAEPAVLSRRPSDLLHQGEEASCKGQLPVSALLARCVLQLNPAGDNNSGNPLLKTVYAFASPLCPLSSLV